MHGSRHPSRQAHQEMRLCLQFSGRARRLAAHATDRSSKEAVWLHRIAAREVRMRQASNFRRNAHIPPGFEEPAPDQDCTAETFRHNQSISRAKLQGNRLSSSELNGVITLQVKWPSIDSFLDKGLHKKQTGEKPPPLCCAL